MIGLIVWNKQDMINVSMSASVTLNNFKAYSLDTITGEMKINHDNAQLITYVDSIRFFICIYFLIASHSHVLYSELSLIS